MERNMYCSAYRSTMFCQPPLTAVFHFSPRFYTFTSSETFIGGPKLIQAKIRTDRKKNNNPVLLPPVKPSEQTSHLQPFPTRFPPTNKIHGNISAHPATLETRRFRWSQGQASSSGTELELQEPQTSPQRLLLLSACSHCRGLYPRQCF